MSFRQSNKASDSDAWPFADARNTASVTTTHIMHHGVPILLVTHDAEDGTWQFHHGDIMSMSDALLVALLEIYEHDPSVGELADLPLGWQATRDAVGQPWTRQQSPPDTELTSK